MVTLPIVEVPGLAAAVRKERQLRDRAFLGGNEIVAGVIVRQLSLRTVLYLEHAENGLMIPFRFDDDLEVVAHALQVLYFSQPGWTPPEVRPQGYWNACVSAVRLHRFKQRVFAHVTPEELVREVRDWIDDSLMDCPAGTNGAGLPAKSYASHPAHLADLFAEAGFVFAFDEIMDMPLKRLWQHWRLAAKRVYDYKLTNPSDALAVGVAQGAAA